MSGHRLAVLAIAAVGLTALPPLGDDSASAVGRNRVVRCGQPKQCWITAFAFTPGGNEIFYVERFSGEIRRAAVDGAADRRWAKIGGVATQGEQGVLGIALDPQWDSGPDQQWVYVYYTERRPLRNRIVRLRKTGKRVVRQRLASIPATTFHDGGVIHFGPDGKLYAVTGDAGQPERAQQPSNLGGKVLRLEENGNRPGDNPIAGSKAFSIGHRNSFGFAFDPQTGSLWQTENGPDCDDEVNLVLPGHNYGWGPASDCPNISESGSDPQQPELTFNPLIAPTGAAFCKGCGLGPGVEGDLVMGSYLPDRIYNLSLNAGRNAIDGQDVLYTNSTLVLAVEAAPDGRVYFSDPRGVYRLTG
ncbi:MAG TPA: PQQ-dependent sugar dehydrogenase [Actinomycetota bacterium]|nr:PQQ-dependent sugar dehydrogenase [Actinomycetota bacterium]